MTTPHRATPEQWANIERWGAADHHSDSSCILELRARIEALEKFREAMQRPPVFSVDEVKPIVMPVPDSAWGDSLVSKVARLHSDEFDDYTFYELACMAIREVAQALIEWHDSDQVVHTAYEAAKWLEREANK